MLHVAEGVLPLGRLCFVHALLLPTPHGLLHRACARRPLPFPDAGFPSAFSRSHLASARTRFALIVATCSSDSLCVCAAAERCLPRQVPARFLSARASLSAEGEEEHICLRVQHAQAVLPSCNLASLFVLFVLCSFSWSLGNAASVT